MRRSVNLQKPVEDALLEARGDLIFKRKRDYDMTDAINFFIMMGVHRYWKFEAEAKEESENNWCECEKELLTVLTEKTSKREALIDQYETMILDGKYEKTHARQGTRREAKKAVDSKADPKRAPAN